MKNIALFMLTPILIYEHPWHIMVDISRRIKRKDGEEEITAAVPVETKEEAPSAGRTNLDEQTPLYYAEETKQTLMPLCESRESTDALGDVERQQMAKALKLNEEGNKAVNQHKFNEAHRKYTEGMKVFGDDDNHCKLLA
eukprot:15069_1